MAQTKVPAKARNVAPKKRISRKATTKATAPKRGPGRPRKTEVKPVAKKPVKRTIKKVDNMPYEYEKFTGKELAIIVGFMLGGVALIVAFAGVIK